MGWLMVRKNTEIYLNIRFMGQLSRLYCVTNPRDAQNGFKSHLIHFIPNERVEIMSKALKAVNTKRTAQTNQADPGQVKNNAGGFTFTVSKWDRLERFLILGTDGGTYYVSQKDLTKQNVDFVKELLKKDAKEVIRRTVDVSDNGRAKSNSPALFVLALAMNTDGIDKSVVSSALQKIARTATHLFEYAQYLENLGGWGRAKRNSIANWYGSKTPVQLAYQAVKYRQRNGWTHKDLFALTHPKGINENVGNFILGKEWTAEGPAILNGFAHAQNAKTIDEAVYAVTEYGLPWEAVPTQFHKNLSLWRALFDADLLGQTALLRNVTRFAKLGAFNDMFFVKEFADRLADSDRIAKGRVHPISYLNALVTFSEGQMERGTHYYASRNKTWESNSKISAALDAGFYNAFKAVVPANKRTLVGVDVSGSMGSMASGLDLTCAQVAGAVSMTIARTEPFSMMRGFSTQFVDLGITENMSLGGVMRTMRGRPFSGTDCALPMVWALKNKVEVDTFVIITDNETWYGSIHPHQALKEYRNKMGIDARLAVLGVSATDFTIADPSDKGQMDFVGFDSAAPKVLADFSAGRI